MNELTTVKLQALIGGMNFSLLTPHLLVASGAIVLMLFSLLKNRAFLLNALTTVFILLLAAFSAINSPNGTAANGMVSSDLFSQTSIVLYCLAGILLTVISYGYLLRRALAVAEYFSLLLFAILGMMLMSSASDLMVFFIALEILSVSLYVLLALDNRDLRSVEAAIKYFLTSVFASAFILFGIAFVYGATGSTNYAQLKELSVSLSSEQLPLLLPGLLLFLAGIAFKISLVPFHLWTPDVYQGAPASITALLSTGPKIAAFSLLFRIFYIFKASVLFSGFLQPVFVALAIVSMIVGNLLALKQKDLKRLLAYSSITHMGYLTMAFVSRSESAVSTAFFYFFAYLFMNLGVFAILSLLARGKDENLTLENMRGLASRQPVLALVFLVLLFSLAGIPPLLGFASKFFVFSAVIDAKLYGLAVIGILNSAVSAYYYLRVVVHMYFKQADETSSPATVTLSFAEKLVLAVSFLAVVSLGVQPAVLLQWFSRIV